MISRFSQQVQDQDKFQVSWEEIKKIQESREVWFQDSREDEFKIQEKKSGRLHKGSIEKFFSKKKNIAQFCFSKEFFSKFSKLPNILLSGNRLPVSYNWLPVAKFDFKSFQLNLQCSNWFQNDVIDYKILVIDYQCIWTLKFKINCEESHPFTKMLCVFDYNDLVINYQW